MASPTLTDEELQRALDAYAQCLGEGLQDGHGAAREAARRLGISESTLRRRRMLAARRGLEAGRRTPVYEAPKSAIEYPDFPDEDVSPEQIIDHLTKRFEKRHASHKAHTWFKVKVKDKKPIGVLWYGDPHLDDNGTNWPVLRRHVDYCKNVDGLYGANIGDTTNNWQGRLVAQYAKQDTSLKTAQKLAAWFMLESGVKWLVWLLGNHDAWGDGSGVLAQMAKRFGTQEVIMHDWEARFSLAFPNGHEFRVWASHDFKGHSMWNPLHGPLRAAKFGKDADLLVAGHKHNWGIFTYENADRGIKQTMIRTRGFKMDDDYARRIGIQEQEGGCSILTIFDPIQKDILAFDNIELGVKVLQSMRGGI